MQINVSQKEILAGLVMYLTSRGFQGLTPENLKVSFSQGRGDKGQLTGCIEELDGPVSQEQPSETVVKEPSAKATKTKATPTTDALPVELGGTATKAQVTAEEAVQDPAPTTAVKAIEEEAVASDVSKDPEPQGESLFA